MKIIPEIFNQKGSKTEQELVENEKQEYKLIGRYLRTRGLKLFAYRPYLSISDELVEVVTTELNSINLIVDSEKQELIAKDLGVERADINSKDIHFEALNMKNAKRRLEKFKQGKIQELCNLRIASPNGISFY